MIVKKPAIKISSNFGDNNVTGKFLDIAGERFYVIKNVDNMPTFFISLISSSDHWLYVASNGGLTAGRVSPEKSLFPYVTVDKVYDSTLHTGPRSLFKITTENDTKLWEPFNVEQHNRHTIQRNIYKNSLGNKVLFEEINYDLKIKFCYSWSTSEEYGFVKTCYLENFGDKNTQIEVLDGLINILPAGTPRFTQTNSSYLVDAYKWNELDESSGLAMYTLYSAITDRAEPCESLKSNIVFNLGLSNPKIMLGLDVIENFKKNIPLQSEKIMRGVRGCYWVNDRVNLKVEENITWQIIADVEQDQISVVKRIRELHSESKLQKSISDSIEYGSDYLARIMASADAFQIAKDENVTVHHYANVMFNVLRGGIFNDQYRVNKKDFTENIKCFSKPIFKNNRRFLASLPDSISYPALLGLLSAQEDKQLYRLGLEYLPIRFGRRHGDPSRPWNQFEINLKDEDGHDILYYQGNWRDIFQNWEALLISYPEFIVGVVAKFVNASTMDGYNPYRITKQGIDWEVEDPDDPWSYIGYWGDHQIIYLLKLLELSRNYYPEKLIDLLDKNLFSYANVPYRINAIDDLIEDPKSTVVYDNDLAALIEQREAIIGTDGKLILNSKNEVYQVNLLEKLLVPLLAKLGNLVVGGGIWLNTQRPEWNDANNALVGQGLSMVTLYYIRRYIDFLQDILDGVSGSIEISIDVCEWLNETTKALKNTAIKISNDKISSSLRGDLTVELGSSASNYRGKIYQKLSYNEKDVIEYSSVHEMFVSAKKIIDHSIKNNLRDDGLYHSYNLMNWNSKSSISLDYLYPMLEGQVAVLSSGLIGPKDAVILLKALFNSDLYRDDQNTFILYPDRPFTSFLDKNILPVDKVKSIPMLDLMLNEKDRRLIEPDANGNYRFNADFVNSKQLISRIDELAEEYSESYELSKQCILELYEQVFNHKAFTGRSGGMFGFEGLGSIYWHMVAKLLLAVQEVFFQSRINTVDAIDSDVSNQLAILYYRIRYGIGFNKDPFEYGAFPTDPYSHTPKHIGAQQPGMTGQVKEEIIARYGELGVHVINGKIYFDLGLLQANEFIELENTFRYLDVQSKWQSLFIEKGCLAFSWCQVPFVYKLSGDVEPSIQVFYSNGSSKILHELSLSEDISKDIFSRSGMISRIEVAVLKEQLFIQS